MKIFLVAHGFPPETDGGTERAVAALGTAMQATGHDVTVVAGSLVAAPCDRVDVEEHAGLPVLRLHRDDLYFESWWKAHSPGVSRAFRRLLREHRPDVVHVHHWQRLSTDLVRAAVDAGCVAAATVHDYFTALASPVRLATQARPEPSAGGPSYLGAAEVAEAFAFHRRDFRAELCAAHLLCAPSASHAAGVQEMADGPLGAIEVTPPPLLELPARRAPADPAARGRRLVTWGSLYPEKGLETVLDAMRAVDGWSLDVHGAAHHEDYRQQVEKSAAGLDVRFHGRFATADLETVDADYAVLASYCHESYGLTMDEAQFLGLPVLAADLPSYRERGLGDTCAFFTPGDAGSLAALLRDEKRLRQLAVPQPPDVIDAESSARTLLDYYAAAKAGARRTAPTVEPIDQSERTLRAFRRAERRLWTALQQGEPPAPPDDFPPT